MGSIGSAEILVILVLALLLFGPRKLPEMSRNIARALREFRRAGSDLRDTLEREVDDLDRAENRPPHTDMAPRPREAGDKAETGESAPKETDGERE